MLWWLLACAAPDSDADRGLDVSAESPLPFDRPGVAPWRRSEPALPKRLPERVVVIGGGVAGMTAAIDAAAAGVNVVVLEREQTVGGSALHAQHMLFSGSPEQEAAGVEDSPDQLLVEWPSFTGGNVSDPWVRYFAEHNVPDVRMWLGGLGLSWGSPFPDDSGGTTARLHSIEGRGEALVDTLYAALPPGSLRLGVEATGLELDAYGRVTGVDYVDLDTGQTGVVEARAVVVATGGFGWNLERVREARPDLADVVLTRASWSGADGNGLAMLEGVGAATQNLAAVGLYAHGSRCPDTPELEMQVPFLTRVPWVGQASGARFVNETATNDFHTAEAIVDDGGAAWMAFGLGAVFDNPVCGRDGDAERSYTPEELVSAGFARRAETPADLAVAIGVDPAAFTASLDAYNAAVRSGGPDAFRDSMAGAFPVDVPPLYAMPVAVSVAKMFGGIDVDLHGRVLATDGRVIPGLYAAGELTGMAGGSLVGDAGFTGSLTAVVLGARVAGQHAASDPIVIRR